jgi:murein tripeptide amidase MpaA
MLRRRLIGFAAVAICLLLVPAGWAQMARYDGNKVVRVQVQDEQQLTLLLALTDDVWNDNVGVGPLDVRVTPEQYELLQASGLNYSILIDDLQPLIDAQMAGGALAGTWDAYMNYAQLVAYMNTLVALRPDLASTFTIGKTYLNQDINGIRISGSASAKPGVVYFGAEHAREWIGPPVALYVADQLVRNYDTDPVVKDLVDRIEWFIIPVFNRDGYEYTWTSDRMWRKNRHGQGVDINRNWGLGWGGEGSSGSPGDETYRGTAAFSEPETQAMRDFILAHPTIVATNDLHSYAQLMMWPWGYQSAYCPDNAEFSYAGAVQSSLLYAVHGTSFGYGPVYTTIYPASGVSVDWIYGSANPTNPIWAFTYELRDTGTYGFTLPASQILPSCEETWPALRFLADWASSTFALTYPNGGESLPVNQPATITWTGMSTAQHQVQYTANYNAGSQQIGDGFESGLSADYQTGGTGNHGWYVTTGTVHGGTKSCRSGAIGDSSNTWLTRTAAAGSFSFWYKVSSENTYDWFNFYIDGVQKVHKSGEVAWTQYSTTLTSGNHTLRWEYVKDAYATGGSDTIWIDDLSLYADTTVWTDIGGLTPPGTKQLAWTPTTLGTNYKVRVRPYVAGQPGDWDESNATFSVVAGLVLGDMNCDDVLDGFDIDPFFEALGDPAAWQANHPGCDLMAGDCNQDGYFDGFDIDVFFDLLAG